MNLIDSSLGTSGVGSDALIAKINVLRVLRLARISSAFRWWVAVIPGCDGGLSQQCKDAIPAAGAVPRFKSSSQMKQWCPCFPVLS